jgi:hypothetical protein
MSDLFEFINGMIVKPTEFKKTKMHERAKHFFMVSRFSAIKFPVQASYFNHIKINPAQVVTFWQETWSKMYSRTPSWMYVKTKKAKEAAKAKQPFTDELIRTYCEKFQMSRRDFDESLNLLGDNFISEVKQFEYLITQ